MKKLIFDTSGINGLLDDSDVLAIVQSLAFAYRVGITETVLAEIAANSNVERRMALLDLLKRLLNCGKCTMPYQWIMEQQAKAYQRQPDTYDWRTLDIRFLAAEAEIARQLVIHSVGDETRTSLKDWDKEFREIFTDARPAFQQIFEAISEIRPSLREVTEKLLSDGGAHLSIGADLMARATGEPNSELEFKAFMERCPPFKALLVALCFSQHDRCIRGEREPSLGKAGRLDMFSAVYLPYCNVFVTNDDGQCKALQAVAGLMDMDVSILMYEDFRNGLVGLCL